MRMEVEFFSFFPSRRLLNVVKKQASKKAKRENVETMQTAY